jgi:hypothetical protein
VRLEAVRIITDWLQVATYGANAKLLLVALDGSDSRPAPIATFADETRNAAAAFRRFDGLTMPAVIVTVPDEMEHRDPVLPQSGERSDAYVTIQIRYAERTAAAEAAIANGSYVAKAIIGSLRELHKNENVASRTRNGIRLVSCEELRELGQYEDVADTWLLAAVQARYYVSDLTPMGA